MKTLVIFNPGSRSGQSRKHLKTLEDFLMDGGQGSELRVTRCLEDARLWSQEACEKNAELVVAVGGDGTINQTLCGLYGGSGQRISATKLGVVYTGTSPDFCKSYHLPYHNVRRSLEALKLGKEGVLYPGKIVLQSDPLSPPQTRYFGCAANLGLGAAVARGANGGIRKILGDRGGTFLALLRSFFRYKPSTFEVIQDGEAQSFPETVALSLGRTTHIASGIKIVLPEPLKEDELYMMVVQKVGFLDVFRCLRKLYGGQVLTEDKNFRLRRVKTVRVERGIGNPEIEFDGDPQGELPCLISVASQPVILKGVL